MSTLAEPRAIASVSLADADKDPDAFAAAIGSSFERYGFAIINNHGIAPELIKRAEAAAKAFFALPENVKRGYKLPNAGGQRGYTPFGVETAKGATQHDLKEFWHVGRELPPGDPLRQFMPDNIWPREIADFEATFSELYSAFETAGLRVLSAIARHLKLPPDWFEDTVENGNSILRLLHYPPIGPDAPGVRAGAHEDINTITLLLGAEEAGLELLDRDGRWLPVSPHEGELVINVGDMLQRLTNHQLKSTTHRVVNPPPERRGKARYSMPFFLHFRPDFRIKTLPQCVDAAHPDRYPQSITADEYLMERLREIKLV